MVREVKSSWSREKGEPHPRLAELPVAAAARPTLARMAILRTPLAKAGMAPLRCAETAHPSLAVKALRPFSKRLSGA